MANQRLSKSQPSQAALPEGMPALLKDLHFAIEQRCYDEAEQLGYALLDLSPSEEVDQAIHEIITSATTIRDAEEEIRYQYGDLETALEQTQASSLIIPGTETDGL